MRSVGDYIDAAKDSQNIEADWKLAIVMGVSPSMPHQWRSGKCFPSDERMVQLANLAKLPPDIALLDLHRVRATDPAVRSAWVNILQRIAVAVVVALLPVGATRVSVANAQDTKAPYEIGTMYIIKKSKARFRIKVLALLTAIFRLLLTNVAYSR